MEAKIKDFDHTSFALKTDIQPVRTRVNAITNKNGDLLAKLDQFEKKYNEVLELFALQHKEFLKLQDMLKAPVTTITTEITTSEEDSSTPEADAEVTTETRITLEVNDTEEAETTEAETTETDTAADISKEADAGEE
jgi:hypothetical protein